MTNPHRTLLQICSQGSWFTRKRNDVGIYCGLDPVAPPRIVAAVSREGMPFQEFDTNRMMLAMSKRMALVLSEIAALEMDGVPSHVAFVLGKAAKMIGDMEDYVATRDRDDSLDD